MIETTATCECGTHLVPWKRWRPLTAEQRADAYASGCARAATATECKRCYERRRYREAREAEGREVNPGWHSGYTREELLAELDMLNPAWRNLPMLTMCRELAPRLGMNADALEQRLRRYGFRSRFDCSGNFRGDVAA